MDITIRSAQPGDVKAVVPLLYASGPHEFDYVYTTAGTSAHEYLAFAFPTGRGFSSYHICTVAEVDGEVIGIAACHSGWDNSSIDRGNIANMWRYYSIRDFLAVAQRGLRIATTMPPPDKDTDYISQVGVKEEFRGRGVGTALVRHLIGLARQKGRRKCALDVAVTNPEAQRLYERLGFRVVQENRWKYRQTHPDVPDQRRMEMVLT